MSYPTATTTFPTASGSEVLNSLGSGVGLAGMLNNLGIDLTAVETKIGTGSSTPTSNAVLAGSGTGTSAWATTLAGLTLTTPTIASFANAQHGHTNAAGGGTLNAASAIQGGTVSFANLLSTIFSGQTSTQANAGTAGGTMSYINLGGIKLLWCRTGVLSVANNTSTTYTFTFPTSFFSTTSANFLTTENNAVSDRINSFFSVATTTTGTTIALRDFAAAGTASTQVNLLVIGT